MAGILTKKFEVDLTQQFIDDVRDETNGYYVFTSKSTPWADDNLPPSANLSLTTYEQDVYAGLLYGKRVTDNDIVLLVRRYDWANNTFYPAYDKDDEELYSKQFYVYNQNNRAVYKVIETGSGNSVVLPTIISTSPFKTSDGYIWKYMFTADSTAMNKFGSNNYIPLQSNTQVEAAAIPGAIDTIKVLDGGSEWLAYDTGVLRAVVNNSVVILANTASAISDFYIGSSLYLKSGLGSGQIRSIIDYDGSTKQVVLSPALDVDVNLNLNSITGTFFVGDEITQNVIALAITSQYGFIQPNTTIIQSNTYATGLIVSANTSYLKVKPLTGTFTSNHAIDGGTGQTLGNSTVTTTAGANTVTAAANALFTTLYEVGGYIKVGNTTNYSIRRITSITNTTFLNVSDNFNVSYTANSHWRLSSAATVATVTDISSQGTVKFVDTSSVELSINTLAGQFILGEVISQVNSTSNGVVSFANSTKIILTNVTGPGFQSSNTTYMFPVVGVTSNASANVQMVEEKPTITLTSNSNSFLYGTQITSSSGATANVVGSKILPNEQTEYIVTPTVTIDGNGQDAKAYCVVNTTTYEISSVVVFDPGFGYTQANVTVSTNTVFGANASLKAVIGPIEGHGSNAAIELGASYAGVYVNFGNTYNEQYNLPGYGEFRTVGLIKNPEFDNVFLTLNNYDRATLFLTGANTFTVGEVVYQANLATGIVVSGSTSEVELKSVKGTFDPLAANTTLIGLTSGVTTTLAAANINYFVADANSNVVQETSGATGVVVSTPNTSVIRLSNVKGVFGTNDVVYDLSANAFATVTDVKTANNTKTLTFNQFNQIARMSLSQSSGIFEKDEVVEFRTQPTNTKIGSGIVYNVDKELDILFTGNTTNFITNEVINQGMNGSGILLAANSTHMKLTGVQGTFSTTTVITGQTSGANASITQTLPVICVTNIEGTLTESEQTLIVGLTSNAAGYCALANTIVRPNLIRDTGSVLYIENTTQPIEKTDTSTESVNIVLKF